MNPALRKLLAGVGSLADPFRIAIAGYDPADDANRVKSVQKKWRSDFSGVAISATKWDTPAPTGGMTSTVANGLLSIAMGTTLDAELAIVTKETFTVPVRAIVAVQLSQRISFQTLFVELVSVDPTTGLLDESSVMGWRLMGTSATSGWFDVSTFAQPRLISGAVTIPTTAAPAYSALELEAFADEAWFHGRTMDSASARSSSSVRHQQIPDPNRLYKLRIRARNREWRAGITGIAAGTGGTAVRITRATHGLTTGDNITLENVAGVVGLEATWTGTVTVIDTTNFELNGLTWAGGTWINTGWSTFTPNVAPATATTAVVNFVTVTDYNELTAEITAGRGNNSPGQGLSVNVNTMPTTNVAAAGQQADNSTTIPASVMAGVKAYAANPAVVSSGRIMSLLGTLIGAAIVKPFSIPEADWQYAGPAAGLTVQTDTVVRAAQAAGIRNYVTGCNLGNNSATAGIVEIKDGAGTAMARVFLPANAVVDVNFPTPLKGTAATITYINPITVGMAVVASVQGYSAP